LIKISGDVGSVTAAVESGAALAQRQQGLVSHKVIARPADGLGSLWNPLKAYEAPVAPANTKKPTRTISKPKGSATQSSTSTKTQAAKPTTTAKSRAKKATGSSSQSVAVLEDKEGSNV
jgi:microcompartment protein CcmL/EutN